MPGQWLNGRVYERRCDLSPNGEYLVYFAANYKPPYGTWTAISRPPYFTALALWPKGDAWGGGGLFDSNGKGITLNHRPSEMKMGEGFKLPADFRVRPLGERSGWGEDDPILSYRLKRDGWKRIQNGKWKENRHGSAIWIKYTEPEIWEKKSKSEEASVMIELHGIKEKLGPWYVQELNYHAKGKHVSLGRCDWADIAPSGVLFFSNQGKLYKAMPNGVCEVVTDFSQCSFTEVPPAPEAKKW